MDTMFIFLIVLVFFTVVLRAVNSAARNSALEQHRREVIREYIRKKRLDQLYGRDNEDR